jgi:hypothetical protein
MPEITDQMLADQRREMYATIDSITERTLRLRTSHDALLAALKLVTEVLEEEEPVDPDWRQTIIVSARAAIAAADEFTA